MFLGYNTNGFAHHRLLDALDVIAELGYGGVALTPDVHHLDPAAETYGADLAAVNGKLLDTGLSCVIETGARFLLDPRRKHRPTLLDPQLRDAVKRTHFLMKCVDMAADLGAEVVSFWSGVLPEGEHANAATARLVTRCRQLADYAVERNVKLAFEPEPGMLIDTMPKFADLHAKVNHPSFGLTLDLGHLVCQGELPISRYVREWAPWLWNVHIEDMKAGVHDHLMFGEGEVDFADAFAALKGSDYRGGVYVELSRHSYDAVNAARRSIAFLKEFV